MDRQQYLKDIGFFLRLQAGLTVTGTDWATWEKALTMGLTPREAVKRYLRDTYGSVRASGIVN